MAIYILAPGKTKQHFIREGIAEYEKRLKKYLKVKLIELPDLSLKTNSVQEVIQKESDIITKNIRPGSYISVLDKSGNQISTEEFSGLLEKMLQKDVCFIIGGVYGLSTTIIKKADTVISFSAFTFTHQMIRLLLFEQLYRAIDFLNGGKYHK